ncbi:hypothetical protein NPIL_360631 [Nephila pilipes]|uniref:Uncharacterized protein n=1 Tax=Nephila pilipes TaxID=299642 RepID=A0A8X6TZS5_NEPPI|nr:hypothetical protein NPIL_360631 [Nephila pilipes]
MTSSDKKELPAKCNPPGPLSSKGARLQILYKATLTLMISGHIKCSNADVIAWIIAGYFFLCLFFFLECNSQEKVIFSFQSEKEKDVNIIRVYAKVFLNPHLTDFSESPFQILSCDRQNSGII